MSFSWVDPHFVALYARREEERLAERLVTRLRERAACEPSEAPGAVEPDRRLRAASRRRLSV